MFSCVNTSKDSVLVTGLCNGCNALSFRATLTNPPAGGPPLVTRLRLLLQHTYSIYPSYRQPENVSWSRNGDLLDMDRAHEFVGLIFCSAATFREIRTQPSELDLYTRVYDRKIKFWLPAVTEISLIRTGSQPHPSFYATGTGLSSRALCDVFSIYSNSTNISVTWEETTTP